MAKAKRETEKLQWQLRIFLKGSTWGLDQSTTEKSFEKFLSEAVSSRPNQPHCLNTKNPPAPSTPPAPVLHDVPSRKSPLRLVPPAIARPPGEQRQLTCPRPVSLILQRQRQLTPQDVGRYKSQLQRGLCKNTLGLLSVAAKAGSSLSAGR